MKNYLLISIWITSAFWIGSCDQKESYKETSDIKKRKSTGLSTKVVVVESMKKPFQYRIYAHGKIQSKQQILLKFKNSGILTKVNNKNGDWVKKGQVIAELNKTMLRLALKKAETQLKEKEWAYQDLVIQYFGESDDGEENEIHESLKIKSGLIQARLSFQEAEINLQNTVIKAPISGIIADIGVKQGNLVTSADKVAVVYNPNDLEITSEILEDDLGEIQLGQTVLVELLSYPEQLFQATVMEINPMINEQGLVKIKSKVKGSDLLPGMNASITIIVPKSENIIVPKEAVVIRSGKKVVFTFENNLAKWNYVTTGLENGIEIEVLEGLSYPSQIIVSNNLQLAHDAPVVTETKIIHK